MGEGLAKSPIPLSLPLVPQPPPSESLCGTLVLVAARNPYDWTRAMHRVCHCCEVCVYGFEGWG